ncbi:MAG: hypothetical protein H0T79_09140 [Deltaproteobacteria bacterium]|nr:hypothetical protein [Deltaproteobacteria bacterium]
MLKPSCFLLTSLLLVGAAGCPAIDVDPGEGVDDPVVAGAVVEFDPSNSIIPFPNNLILDPTTGKVKAPAGRCESATSKAVREGVLNTLDGFGTYETAISVTFSEAMKFESVEGKVKLYQRTSGTTAMMKEIPTVLLPSMSVRFLDAADCTNVGLIPAVVIVPMGVLEQRSTHTVALLDGIETAAGGTFGPSLTWAIVRSNGAPVVIEGDVVVENNTPIAIPLNDPEAAAATLARLKGVELLWKAHHPALDFLAAQGHDRKTVTLAWDFTTQTTTDPLDPAVADSAASKTFTTGFLGLVDVSGGLGGEAFLISRLGEQKCLALGCANVQDVLGGLIQSESWQQLHANPLAGGAMIPGAWTDPVKPTNPVDNNLATLVVIPKGTMPAAGWPTIIFGHGLGSSKESLVAIGSQLAGKGFASVAIDFQAHGSRAVRTSNAAALDCADDTTTVPATPPSPTAKPQCFAPFLSTDLAGTRDNIRQTVLDLHRLSRVLIACGMGANGCVGSTKNFKSDPAKVSYMGISLGGIIGSTFTSVNPTVKSAVLNVPGVGLLDILENTQTAAIRCSLVNGLIDAGIVMGEKFTGQNPTTALCLATDQGWKTQPGYRQFSAIARWILDPADGANFTPKLAPKRFLIQEVVGDTVVPNIATDREAALTGLTPADADPATSSTPAPSAAITTNPMTTKFVKYPTLPGAGAFPGNTFAHASLLQPPNANADGQLGTVRLQTDAIAFLLFNN